MNSIFTQYRLDDYLYFPRTLPELYVRSNEPYSTKPYEYFIELVSITQFFVVKEQIDQYTAHYEEKGWIKTKNPEVFFIISKSSLKKKIDEYIESLIVNGYVDEVDIILSTSSSLFHS